MSIVSKPLYSLPEVAALLNHDLRAPLQQLSYFATILRRKADADNGLGEFAAALEHLGDDTRTILDWLRYAGQQEPGVVTTQQAQEVYALALSEAGLGERGAGLHIRTELEERPFPFYKGLLKDLIKQLIRNAAAVSETVLVQIRIDNQQLELTVTDEGRGINTDLKEQIRQLAPGGNTRELFRYGYRIIRSMLNLTGGSIHFPERDRGTCVQIRIPLPENQ